MTNNQFNLLMMHGGMMQDGLSSEAALSMLIFMQEPSGDIIWLKEYLKASAEAEGPTPTDAAFHQLRERLKHIKSATP